MIRTTKLLLSNERDAQWGLTVCAVGHEKKDPQEEYAAPRSADTRTGANDSYRLHLIVEGKGTVNSRTTKNMTVTAGHALLVHPNEWFAWWPDRQPAWEHYWIAFKGTDMDERVAAGFFPKDRTTWRVGYAPDLLLLYKRALSIADNEPVYFQQALAGIVNDMLGTLYALERETEMNKRRNTTDTVNRGLLRIREAIESNITVQQVADEIGMSYANFRKLFKKNTGCSPARYQQTLKIERAKELLSSSNLSVKEIAYRLCFSSPDYFSAMFKRATGRKPSDYRMDISASET